MRISTLAAIVASLAIASSASAQFTYDPAGTLVSGSGRGRADTRVYAPDMRFPIRDAPSYANSQVWGVGGSEGPSGSQCDTRNYSYPWHDNYCETRTWDMPLCPSGTGHQGQDIRGPSCTAERHAVIAVVSGTITNVGSYSVYLTAADGTRYDYLHMRPVTVTSGERVTAGDVIGYVANEFGGTPTTTHLHFNIRQNVTGVGTVYVPPYTSLIRAYEALVGGSSGPRFAAEYVHQTFPLSEAAFELTPGTEVEGYLELRNTGSETWRPDQTFLATTEPRDGASPLRASDWISASRAATVDRVVAPGATGRFVFSVRAPAATGEYPQFFNVFQDGTWFGDDGGPPDRWIEIRVTVVPGMTTDPDDDADGVTIGEGDCDDRDPASYPGAREICGDGVDQDCSGTDLACPVDVDAFLPERPDAYTTSLPDPIDAGASVPVDAPDPRNSWRGGGASGCGCRVAGSDDRALSSLVLLAIAIAMLGRRRHRET
ncbi:MAG: peptidoglycan DD-metalloendopeptidase family protein [Deltaproteobacteria bacterium]|nr:peptidoglycan DD-metalloendopeptidase family protein [Deltaproteobacteria bacterium]